MDDFDWAMFKFADYKSQHQRVQTVTSGEAVSRSPDLPGNPSRSMVRADLARVAADGSKPSDIGGTLVGHWWKYGMVIKVSTESHQSWSIDFRWLTFQVMFLGDLLFCHPGESTLGGIYMECTFDVLDPFNKSRFSNPCWKHWIGLMVSGFGQHWTQTLL